MPFITQGKTNLSYILIVVILAIIVGGGILWCATKKETAPLEVKYQEKTTTRENEIPSTKDDISSELAFLILDDAIRDCNENALPERCPSKNVTLLKDLDFEFETNDLNDDMKKEVFILPTSFPAYFFRSQRLVGPIWIYQKIDGKWRNIGEIYGGMDVQAIDEKTDGYKKILTYTLFGPCGVTSTEWAWRESELKYYLESSKDVEDALCGPNYPE